MSRYIPNTAEQQKEMLYQLGLDSIEDLFSHIPEKVRFRGRLNIPEALSELELLSHMRELAEKNVNTDDYVCFLGAGAYDHYIPSVVGHIVSRSEFYTAYTPYQPEISQGTLQAIFEYQTMICELTGMDAANASMYDGATALAEAAVMARQATKRTKVLVAGTVHPEAREVLKTYSKFNGLEISELGFGKDGRLNMQELEEKIMNDTAAVIVQNPNFFGIIEDLKNASDLAHKHKALFIAYVDPISLALLKSPGELGADIVAGEGQALGNSLSFGGPYLGFLAATRENIRRMPGRIAGQTVDKNGNRGFVLTIQTREQHIRREKANSNICSNQALNALTATVYMSVMGKRGLRETADLCLKKAHYAYNKLLETGYFEPVFTGSFFKEFAVRSRIPVKVLNEKLLDNGIIGGLELAGYYHGLQDCWLVAVTEKRTKKEIDNFVELSAKEALK